VTIAGTGRDYSMDDQAFQLLVSRFDNVDARLDSIDERLRQKTESNGTQNVEIQEICDRVGVLESAKKWTAKKTAIWMLVFMMITALVSHIEKIVGLF